MKRLLFLFGFLVCLVSAFGQSGKFKAVTRTTADSTAGSFTKDAQVIDGSKAQLRSDGTLNPYLSKVQLPQLPDSINNDSVPVLVLKPVDPKPVFIERERSQLRAAQMMSNEEVTYAFFRETPSLHIPEPEEQIRINKVDTDNLGMSHVKGVQLFRNIPVYGMEFTFHISSQSERFTGYTLNPGLIDTVSARLNAEEAVRIAENDLSRTTEIKQLSDFIKKLLKYESPTAAFIYYPDKFNKYRISYKVIIRPNMRDEWIYYIDAQNGEILEKFNNTPTAGPAKGTGTDLNNTQRTVDTYEENGTYYMVNTTKPMFNTTNFTGTINIIDAHNNKDIYTSNPTASLATSKSTQWNNPNAISAMHHVSLTYDYFKNTFNRNSFDDKGMDIICFINVPDENGQAMDNAFWTGSSIAFGNGKDYFLPLAGGLDCVAHEMGHGVVSNTAKLEYKNQSGAINEGYADLFGAMVDRSNWTIGEKIIRNKAYFPSGTMRDMANPHNGGAGLQDNYWQPAHVSEMYLGTEDNGGVHINNSISSLAYYTYATSTSKEKAEQVFYRALCNYLTSTSKFVDYRIAVTQAAKDLYGDADAQLVGKAFDKVGISEDAGSGQPGNLPTNPGQQGLLLTSLSTYDYGLYKTMDYSNFTPLTTNRIYSRPSVTDDGKYVLFINTNNIIRMLDLTTGQEGAVSTDAGYANVAISRDGNRMAFVTTQQDAKIYVYDFVSGQMAAFQLYNPTTGTGGVQSGGVKFAESLEFDHTGEYVLYDAYNVVGSTLSGEQIDFWDIGMLHVWNNSAKSFGTGQIAKLFAMLEPGMSVGNPTFSKNSPHIIAFDYMDKNQNYATFGMNLSTGALNVLFTNPTTAFPNYSMDDRTIAFASYNMTPFVGAVALGEDKISISGQGTGIANYATFPVFFGTGARPLGLKPAAAFSADIRSGGAPITAQFVDLTENNPSSWSWTFQGGTPATSTQQHPKVTYKLPGTYPVKLVATNSYGSGEVVKQAYITVGTSGMETVAQKPITVYPNPTTGALRVTGDKLQVGEEYNIYNVTGQSVMQGKWSDNGIDVTSLATGMYYLTISGQTVKFVKQ